MKDINEINKHARVMLESVFNKSFEPLQAKLEKKLEDQCEYLAYNVNELKKEIKRFSETENKFKKMLPIITEELEESREQTKQLSISVKKNYYVTWALLALCIVSNACILLIVIKCMF